MASYKPNEKEASDAKSNTRNFKLFEGVNKGTFLDLGANVGEVSRFALEFGFSNVVAVEAHPENCKKILSRPELKSVKVINKAVDRESGIKMFVSTPQHSINCSARKTKRLKSPAPGYYKEVESVSFNELMSDHKPDAIKMDIEGSEYFCFQDFKPNKNLRFITVEWHGARSKSKWKEILEAECKLKEQGFKRISPKEISMHENGHPKALYYISVYSRELQ